MKKQKTMKIIGFSIPVEMESEIVKRSASMNISKSKFCKTILADFLKSGKKLRIEE
jgi:hypothetical protein